MNLLAILGAVAGLLLYLCSFAMIDANKHYSAFETLTACAVGIAAMITCIYLVDHPHPTMFAVGPMIVITIIIAAGVPTHARSHFVVALTLLEAIAAATIDAACRYNSYTPPIVGTIGLAGMVVALSFAAHAERLKAAK